MTRTATIALLLAFCLPSMGSAAEDDSTEETSAEETSTGKKQEKRALPDYDGRPKQDQAGKRGALWVPRVMMFPFWALWEGTARQPIGAVATQMEKDEVAEKVTEVLTFGTGGKVFLYPTAMLDFGFRPSIGVTLAVNGPPDGAGRTRIQFATGGRKWWLLSARQRFFVAGAPEDNNPWTATQVGFGFLFSQRPDQVFRGIGTDTAGPRTRFFRERFAADVVTELVFGELDGLRLFFEVERNRFGAGRLRRNPSIETVYDVADSREVPRFTTGYAAAATGARLSLDSRKARPANGSGLRIEPFVELHAELAEGGFRSLFFGGEAALFGDFGGNRVIGLRGWMGAVEPLSEGKLLPFTEYVELGGNEVMRGFPQGWFRGLSGAVATLQYTWPIWVYVDGLLFVEAGGAFGRRFDDFDPDNTALSFGMGLRSNQDRDSAFTAHVALGTARFGDRPGIDSVRLVVGTDRGF